MITGANTNVRYRGILFHVQTEDSGRANPHIISHVYHGGTILGSRKTDYREHLEADDLLPIVKGLIDEQHAAMVEQLKSGGFDEAIAERLGETESETELPAPPTTPDTHPEPADSGAPAVAVAPPPAPRAAETVAEESARSGVRVFGQGADIAKPLDEVILDYLSDKARGRAGGASDSARTRSGS